MKLCIVTPSVIKGDGQGRANYEITWEALRRGHQVTLIANRVASDLQQHDRVQWVPIGINHYPTYLLKEIIFAAQSAMWLNQHRQEFDLVQVYGAVTWAIGDVNTAQFVHSGWLNSPVHISRVRHDLYGVYQWLYTSLNAFWERRAFRQAKTVIAISQQVKQELINIGVDPAAIHVIFNGVDPTEFHPGIADRRSLHLPEQVPLALFAGDIRINRKNLDTVLHALVQVPDLHLAVAGITQGSPYPQLAHDLGLDDRVHFLGLRSDVPVLMQSVDIFVFPSRYEPFGIVVIEAMATGIPVITAPSAGAAEIVTPDCGVVLPDSDNVGALAEAMQRLIDDRQTCQKMGQAARRVAEQHSWESKAQGYLDLFETMVGEKAMISV